MKIYLSYTWKLEIKQEDIGIFNFLWVPIPKNLYSLDVLKGKWAINVGGKCSRSFRSHQYIHKNRTLVT